MYVCVLLYYFTINTHIWSINACLYVCYCIIVQLIYTYMEYQCMYVCVLLHYCTINIHIYGVLTHVCMCVIALICNSVHTNMEY